MSEPSLRPPIATAPISVILFAHAFSTETTDALQSWRHALDALRRPYEILLIHETRPEAAEVPEATKRMRTIAFDRSTGFRDALNDAIRSAQYPLLAFGTCDKQYVPGELNGLLKLIDQVDIVVGCRAGGQPPPWRVILDTFLGLASRIVIGVPLMPRVSWLGSQGRGRRWIARWIFSVRVLDPECPFRLMRRALFERMPIQSSGPFVQIEILAKANHLSCLMAEELVSWTPPVEPSSDAISFGNDAYQVFRNPDFGGYPLLAAPTDPAPTNAIAPVA